MAADVAGEEASGVDPKVLAESIEEVRPMLLPAAELVVQDDALVSAQFHVHRAVELLSAREIRSGETVREASAGLESLRDAWQQAIGAAARARGLRLPAVAKAIWVESSAEGAADVARQVVPKGYDDAV